MTSIITYSTRIPWNKKTIGHPLLDEIVTLRDGETPIIDNVYVPLLLHEQEIKIPLKDINEDIIEAYSWTLLDAFLKKINYQIDALIEAADGWAGTILLVQRTIPTMYGYVVAHDRKFDLYITAEYGLVLFFP